MQNQSTNLIIEGTSCANTRDIALALSEDLRLIGEAGYQRFTTEAVRY